MSAGSRSWNPMAINLAQFQALAKRMPSLVKLTVERNRAVRQEAANPQETRWGIDYGYSLSN